MPELTFTYRQFLDQLERLARTGSAAILFYAEDTVTFEVRKPLLTFQRKVTVLKDNPLAGLSSENPLTSMPIGVEEDITIDTQESLSMEEHKIFFRKLTVHI